MMKKITLSALAAFTVAGTAFAGPSTVISSKEYKQPCVTPCFRDQEIQLDLFYSYNDASHQGDSVASDRNFFGPTVTPFTPGFIPEGSTLLENSDLIPAGSTVVGDRRTTVKVPQYFRDGSGGGVGLNYFFYRYVGIGIEGNWWNGTQDGFNGTDSVREIVSLSAPANLTLIDTVARVAGTSVTQLDSTTLLLERKIRFGKTDKSVANQVSGSLILRYPFEGPICWAPYIFGGGGGVFDGEASGFGHIGLGVEFRVTPYMGFFTDWRWQFMGGSSDSNFRDNDRVRDLARALGLQDLSKLEGKDHNDVNMTRVGVRFVF